MINNFKSLIFCIALIGSGNGINAQSLNWAKSVDGILFSQVIPYGYALGSDESGMCIVGAYWGAVDFDPGPGLAIDTANGNGDIYILKLDMDGNLIWYKTIGGLFSEDAATVAINNQGEIFVAGKFSDSVDFDPGPGVFNLIAAATNDSYILKLDANGNFQWVIHYSAQSWQNQSVTSIAVDQAAYVYVSGKFRGTIDFDPGVGVFNMTSTSLSDHYLAKFDAQGNFLDAFFYSTVISQVLPDLSGHLYLIGSFAYTVDFDPDTTVFNIAAPQNASYIVKLDTAFSLCWAEAIEDTIYINDVALDGSDHIVTTGQFSDTIDFDPGPGVYSLASSGVNSIYVARFDTAGNLVWAKAMGGNSISVCHGNSIDVDSEGNIYTGGLFDNTVDFDPGLSVFNITDVDQGDGFLLRLDSSGNFSWAFSIGGSDVDNCWQVKVTPSDKLYGLGVYVDTVDFDPGVGVYNMFSGNGAAMYINEYNRTPQTTSINELNQNDVLIYPNPAKTSFTIFSARPFTDACLTLYNCLGEEVCILKKVNGYQHSFPRNNLPDGIYFLKIKDQENVTAVKRIVLAH